MGGLAMGESGVGSGGFLPELISHLAENPSGRERQMGGDEVLHPGEGHS